MIYQPEEELMQQDLPTCLKCGYEETDLTDFYVGDTWWDCPECGLRMLVNPEPTTVFNIIKRV